MIYSGYVGSGEYDWNEIGTSTQNDGTVIAVNHINAAGQDNEGWAEVESNISGGTITAATFYYYHDAYYISRGAGYDGYLQMGPNSGSCSAEIHSFSTKPTAGWTAVGIDSGDFDQINTTGRTSFHFGVGDPGGTHYRIWNIRSYEHTVGGFFQCRLVIEYTEPSGERRQRVFVM